MGGTGVMEATPRKKNKRSSVSIARSPTESSLWIWSLRRICGQFQLFSLYSKVLMREEVVFHFCFC